MTSDEMREAVARVIYKHMVDPAHEPGMRDSRQAADAILSMISASPVEEENKRLREALEPFADFADFLESETEGFSDLDRLFLTQEDGVFLDVLLVGAFRRARSALTNNISTGSPAESETSGGVG